MVGVGVIGTSTSAVLEVGVGVGPITVAEGVDVGACVGCGGFTVTTAGVAVGCGGASARSGVQEANRVSSR